MNYNRSSGIILHPTSFPGPDGIGDLGPEAYRWIHFLKQAGCQLWQILPLGPTGYGDSPYQSFSAFAGNPFLVSPMLLLDNQLLTPKDLEDRPGFPSNHVNFGEVIPWKITLLNRAFGRFTQSSLPLLHKEYHWFLEENQSWLDDFACFMAIKEFNNGKSWREWPNPLRLHEQKALDEFKSLQAESIERHKFRQFLFYQQWNDVHSFATSQGIQIIGDIPIFVAFDSADAWAHPELFFIDENGDPVSVAGVPPDYFSPTGQLWGNPLYDWEKHRQTGYQWWISRVKATLRMVDIVRVDHFRGFAGYWEIPFGKPTAEFGKWVAGPGPEFFSKLKEVLNDLPIIAEDLGEITPDVFAMRDQFGLPGMKVLQFAFASDPKDPFLPHNYPVNCVAYTGTHDNDTTIGWYNSTTQEERDFCRRYLARSGEDISWDMIRALWSSVAIFSLAPLQDFLNLGTEARMNYPGRPFGNWSWRYQSENINDNLGNRIRDLNYLFLRLSRDQYPKKIPLK